MTDTNEDIFNRVEREEKDETEQAADIFRAAVETGELSTLNQAAEHLETLHAKRSQAVELDMSGSKKRLDARLSQAETDLKTLADTADSQREEQRAKTLAGLASGANVDLDDLEDDDSVLSEAGTAQLSDNLAPREREEKAARLSAAASEAEDMGFSAAAQSYRGKIHMLRKGR